MEGIFSKNLIEMRSSDKKKAKVDIDNFVKRNSDSTTFSDDYFYISNQLKNPQLNFFSIPLLNEINYVNMKGGDFFGAFSNTEKKVDYFIKSNSTYTNVNKNKSTGISFGIPSLNEKIQINKTASLALKNKVEEEFENYLALYPEEIINDYSQSLLHDNQKDNTSTLNNKHYDNFSLFDNNLNNFTSNKKELHNSFKKNKFDNLMLFEDDFNLSLREHEQELVDSTSKYLN